VTDEPSTCPGTKNAVATLYTRHAKRVYGLALAGCQGNKHEAEEIVQETFFSVLKGYEKYFAGRSHEVQEARVMDIANKRIIDRFRYHRARPAEPMADLPAPVCDDPAVSAEHRVMMDYLWQVISADLTPTEHRVAFMTWAMGKDDAFIARVLDIPTEGTVRSHRSRATAKIRRRFGPTMTFPDDRGREEGPS
jgi:RNA polymerase sigma-70 factor, ECF subfamily